MNDLKGRLVIISGPSGAGKSTVVQRLIEECSLPLTLSVSATTRPPRNGEVDGKDYRFFSPEDFENLRKSNAFLECKEVFGRGYWYGTLHEAVSTGLNAGKWVILEIDVHGALAVLRVDPNAITVFVHPGSMEELERRLRTRGTESEDSIRRRLDVAAEEMSMRSHYSHEVINQNIDDTVRQVCELLKQYDRERVVCSKN